MPSGILHARLKSFQDFYVPLYMTLYLLLLQFGSRTNATHEHQKQFEIAKMHSVPIVLVKQSNPLLSQEDCTVVKPYRMFLLQDKT